jgi:hypothetical protein
VIFDETQVRQFVRDGVLERITADRPEVVATGEPGDVWLCHPFVPHAAQPHRGARPKFMAQPPLPGRGPLRPDRPAADRSPVGRRSRKRSRWASQSDRRPRVVARPRFA